MVKLFNQLLIKGQKMKRLVLSTFCCFLLSLSSYSQTNDFYTIDEFLKVNPEQDQKMKVFSEMIRSKPNKAKTTKKIKIAVIYPGIQLSDYWVRSLKSFKLRLDELGINYELKEYFTQVGQHRKQTADIKNALKEKPDYMIFTLAVRKHQKLIGRILSENKTKLILQNITTPLKQWSKSQPLLYVGFDHIEGSKLLANYYKKKLNNKGTYSMFYYQEGYIADMRGTQFIKYFDKISDIKLTSTYYTEGKFDKSKSAAKSLLKKKTRPSFIYASSTDIALGAIQAIKAKKLKNPPIVNGWGGGSSELKSIMAGDMTVTVMRMNDDNGVAMAEAIKLVEQGNESKVPTIYSGDFVLVEKGISKEEITKLKERAFRYSGFSKK